MLKNWKLLQSQGPIFGTSIHSGHHIRDSIVQKMKISDAQRRFEEDPMTQNFALLCDHSLVCHTSRFEFDLNRQRDMAIYDKPEDAWGLDLWNEKLSEDDIKKSLGLYDNFYKSMEEFIEELLKKHSKILLLDFHSYNQRDTKDFPDIDLGFTEVNKNKFSHIADRFYESIKSNTSNFSTGINKRFPDGGHWPEWVYAKYKDRICIITVEFKKCFMDENTGIVDLNKMDQLQLIMRTAISDVRELLND